MSSDKTTPIEFESGKQRLLRYTIVTVNTVTVLSSIIFVTWVLGKIISALHALVFSLAFAETPDQFPKEFPIFEEALTQVEVQSILQSPEKRPERATLYRVERSNWRP